MAILPLFLAYSPTGLIITLLLTAISYIAFQNLIFSKHIAQWKKSNIPFLAPTFLIGHKYFKNVLNKSYLVAVDRIYRENSDKNAVGFFMGPMPVILIRTPQLIKQVFNRSFETSEPDVNEDISQSVIQLTSRKDKWSFSRKKFAPIFSTSTLSGKHFDKIMKQMNNMLDYAEEAQRTGRPGDVNKMAAYTVLDILSLWLYGKDSNSFKKEGELYQIVTSFHKPSLSRLISGYIRRLFPGARWVPDSLKFLSRKFFDRMTEFISRQVDQKEQNKINENDFLDFMMAMRDDKNTELSMRHMVGFSISMSTFGGDTFYPVSCKAIHLLSLHPAYQDRIREEVIEVMRKHKTSELTFDVVQELTFTQQCVLETGRLYPVTPTNMKICVEDFQVPGTDYIFRKGDKLIYDAYSVQHDPKYYKNPEIFDPERFSPENEKSIPPECYLAFGYGPRKCPGKQIGILLVVTLTAALLLKHKIRPRSHFKQITLEDFHPRLLVNGIAEGFLVDFAPAHSV